VESLYSVTYIDINTLYIIYILRYTLYLIYILKCYIILIDKNIETKVLYFQTW